MKKILLTLIIILSVQSWVKADDVRDFEIEGMSIRDSLLEHVNEKLIIKNSINLYKLDEYYSFVKFFDQDSVYDGFQAHYHKDDKKYRMVSLEGIKLFKNNIEDCYDLREKIVSEVTNLFENPKVVNENKTKLFADKSGKSTVTSTRFYIDQESKYEDLQISCYDWADGFKFGNGTVGTDKLTVSIMTDEYFDFLDRAYQ